LIFDLNGHFKNLPRIEIQIALRRGEAIEFGLGLTGIGVSKLPATTVEIGVDRQPDDGWRQVGRGVDATGNVRGGQCAQRKAAAGAKRSL
jgi:hypothetical protein